MQHLAKKILEEAGWGFPASVVLHLTLALLLIYRVPELSPPAPDQSVNVELVPPKPNAPPSDGKSNTDTKRSPQAFESASAEKEQPAPADHAQPVMNKVEPQKTETHNPISKEENKTLQKPDNSAPSVTELSTDTEGLPAVPKMTAPAPQNPTVTPDKPTEVKVKLTSAQQIYSKDTLSDPRVKQAIGKLPPRDRIVQICGIEALEQVRHQRPGTFPDMLAPSAGVVSETSFTIHDGAFRSRAKWYSIDFKCQVDSKAMKITDFSYSIGKAIPEAQWNSRQLPRD
ncbi:hypothetical protein CEV33_4312 [Brucella grignonensis]|uniref:DUF930 domain-containing protein n=1 Tax=Brucella grignonensis TaxID=94627 RepID=A0A256FN96_9HYPH|nr:DUF930 domain-containing protein [Brucella grignonensis]OYR16303.1 hypothetical protein CEV33_4312 [Brucella grignonensis]